MMCGNEKYCLWPNMRAAAYQLLVVVFATTDEDGGWGGLICGQVRALVEGGADVDAVSRARDGLGGRPLLVAAHAAANGNREVPVEAFPSSPTRV